MFLRRKSQAGRPGRKRGRGKKVMDWLLIGTTLDTDTQGSFKVLIFRLLKYVPSILATATPQSAQSHVFAQQACRGWLAGDGGCRSGCPGPLRRLAGCR